MPTKNKDLESIQVQFEVKQILDEDDGFFRFEGLASTFGNIDLVEDIVEKGAFSESLQNRLPIILWQHYSDEPIGMPEEVRETDEGLFLRARLPKDDSLVSGRVIPQVKVGSIRTMSIGFRIPEGGFEIDSNGVRRLKRVDLMEVSLVTFPANPMAKVSGFKSLDKIFTAIDDLGEIDDDHKSQLKDIVKDNIEEQCAITKDKLSFLDSLGNATVRDFEKSLRDSGLFSKQAATKLASFLNQSDSDDEVEDELLSDLKAMNAKIQKSEINSQLNNILRKFGDSNE